MFILVVLLVLLLFVSQYVDFSRVMDVEYIETTVAGFGIWGPIAFMLIMAIAIIVSPIPSLPLDAAAGVVWGPFLGTLYAVIGAEVGAIVAFLIARTLGRTVMKKLFSKQITFCDTCTDKVITWIVFFSRLFPFFQFDIISYGAGLTNISLRHFAIATFFGMIPVAFLVAYFGESLFIGKSLSVVLSIVLIAAFFIFPWLIHRYNIFGLKDKIRIEDS